MEWHEARYNLLDKATPWRGRSLDSVGRRPGLLANPRPKAREAFPLVKA